VLGQPGAIDEALLERRRVRAAGRFAALLARDPGADPTASPGRRCR
jgi:hypothetical protein